MTGGNPQQAFLLGLPSSPDRHPVPHPVHQSPSWMAHGRNWRWASLIIAVLVSLKSFFVWQLLSALLLLTMFFVIVAALIALFIVICDAAGSTVSWAESVVRSIHFSMHHYVEALKFAGGSFSLMPRHALTEIISLCHDHDVLVSTGGFIEHVLTQEPEAVNRYIKECKEVGFDILEISSGFITLQADDWLRLVERAQKAGLKAKPEVGIQFGAGGATKAEVLEGEGTRDPEWPILLAKRFLAVGA